MYRQHTSNSPPHQYTFPSQKKVLREERLAPSVTEEEMEEYHQWKRGSGLG